jgi:hypothetical protein
LLSSDNYNLYPPQKQYK